MLKLIETSYFSKTRILRNKAFLLLIFFRGLHITSATYWNLSIKRETYQLGWSTSPMQWKWLFLVGQNFSIKRHSVKQNKNQKTKRNENFIKLIEKYLKLEEYVNIYKHICSEVFSKINFVNSKMKVYLMNFITTITFLRKYNME